MPLTLADKGAVYSIIKIRGNDEAKTFLESLGFVCGGEVSIIAEAGGNVIVNVKDSRIGISREMASKIMV